MMLKVRPVVQTYQIDKSEHVVSIMCGNSCTVNDTKLFNTGHIRVTATKKNKTSTNKPGPLLLRSGTFDSASGAQMYRTMNTITGYAISAATQCKTRGHCLKRPKIRY